MWQTTLFGASGWGRVGASFFAFSTFPPILISSSRDAWARKCGNCSSRHRADMIARDVLQLREQLHDVLNITHPCKQLVVEHLDRVSERAARLGAVNTVLFSGATTTAYNTDQRGFAIALANGLPGPRKIWSSNLAPAVQARQLPTRCSRAGSGS